MASTQSAYIKGRNIIDGPLILNEIWDWARRKKKELAFYKVDFDKAFDSINWKYLISVLKAMGFPSKWQGWMMGILFAGRAKFLVNGAATKLINIEKGLRQGDPLSPFLFIIGLEGLNILMKRAVEGGLFKGVKVPNGGPSVSHLFYADDVVFLGEVHSKNFLFLDKTSRCFQLISGLKVNPSKSKLYTLGITKEVAKKWRLI